MSAILIFLTASLGDYIIATPAIEEVRKQFPGRRIVLLTIQSSHESHRAKIKGYAGGEKRAPWVDLTVPHLVDEYYVLDNVTLFSLLAMRRTLKPHSFEAGILMLYPASPWHARLKKLLLMVIVIGFTPIFGWRGPGFLVSRRSQIFQKGLLHHHVVEPFQFLAEMSPPRNFCEADIRFDLRPGKLAESWADAWTARNLAQSERLVVVAPGSIQPHKRWPEASFSALLAKLLMRNIGIRIAVIGTSSDKALAKRLVATAPDHIVSLAGDTSIAQLAALVSRCTLLVGNDGGSMHLGNAMGCKVVSIIPGIEYPNSIEPWNNRDLAVRHPVPCAPCYNTTECPLGHNRCLTELSVDSVLNKCLQALDTRPGENA